MQIDNLGSANSNVATNTNRIGGSVRSSWQKRGEGTKPLGSADHDAPRRCSDEKPHGTVRRKTRVANGVGREDRMRELSLNHEEVVDLPVAGGGLGRLNDATDEFKPACPH